MLDVEMRTSLNEHIDDIIRNLSNMKNKYVHEIENETVVNSILHDI